MMKRAYMVVGCPASGKSWVCEQLTNHYAYVPHDSYMDKTSNRYVDAIKRTAAEATKPLLIETPFSVSQLKEPLEKAGFNLTFAFIQEPYEVLRARYLAREKTTIPDGHLTRQDTYARRAVEYGAFQGTSEKVLDYLRNANPMRMPWQ